MAPLSQDSALPPGLHLSSSGREYLLQPDSYQQAMYTIGPAVLTALEAHIGEDAFRRLLQEWVTRYRYQTATTADFIQLAEEVSKLDLDSFFSGRLIDPADRTTYQPLVSWP